MAGLIYTLCALMAFLCAWLLLQAYCRSRYKLLLYGGLCFVGLTLNNIMVIFDKLIFTEADLSLWRLTVALLAMFILLYGLIWNHE